MKLSRSGNTLVFQIFEQEYWFDYADMKLWHQTHYFDFTRIKL